MAAVEEVWCDLEMHDGARLRLLPTPIDPDEPVRLQDLANFTLDLRTLPVLP